MSNRADGSARGGSWLDRGLAQSLHCAGMVAQIDAVLGVNFVERNGEQQIVR